MDLTEEAKLIMQMEEQKTYFSHMASLFKSYYDKLIASGFNESQALHLTLNYQTIICGGKK